MPADNCVFCLLYVRGEVRDTKSPEVSGEVEEAFREAEIEFQGLVWKTANVGSEFFIDAKGPCHVLESVGDGWEKCRA